MYFSYWILAIFVACLLAAESDLCSVKESSEWGSNPAGGHDACVLGQDT